MAVDIRSRFVRSRPTKWPDDPELRLAYRWFVSLIGEQTWSRRRTEVMRRVASAKTELRTNFDPRPRGHVRLVFASLRVITGPSWRLRLRARLPGHPPNEGTGKTPRSVVSNSRHRRPCATLGNLRAQGPGFWNFRDLGGPMLPAKWLVVRPLCPGIADIEDLRP
jgi:hypothetical protein